jgi:hypothetical protein
MSSTMSPQIINPNCRLLGIGRAPHRTWCRLTHSLSLDSGVATLGTSPSGLRWRRRSGLPNGASRGWPVC